MGDTTFSSRIAIVSADRLYTDGLLNLLQHETEFVPTSVSPGPQLAAQLRALGPAAAVVDGRAPASLALCGLLVTELRVPVVMVSVVDEDAAVRALKLGARGIVYGSEAPERIQRAVALVAGGGMWAPRSVLIAAFEQLKIETTARPAPEAALAERLSTREREVFRHTAAGLGNKEVADRLSISEATVKVHLTHIFQKLGLRGRGELAAAYHGIRR